MKPNNGAYFSLNRQILIAPYRPQRRKLSGGDSSSVIPRSNVAAENLTRYAADRREAASSSSSVAVFAHFDFIVVK